MRHNERGAEMMSWLPWYYVDSRIMNEIIHAQSKEIVAVRECILYILAQFYVDTADEFGIGLWEKELGLMPKEGASLELRKAQVKAKLQRPPIMTPLQIQSIINLFVDGKTARVYECPGTYHFRIDIPFGDLIWRAEMLEAVEEAKPAHLGFHIRYTLINHELEDSAEIGEDIDEAAFLAGAAVRYEDYIPYGGGIDAAKYDGSLQYGGGQIDAGGSRLYDGATPFSGFDPGDAPQFGKELTYHFRYDGRAVFQKEFQYDGAIRYDGFRPYKLEYDDFLDELGIVFIRLGEAGKPSFEDRVDTALNFGGLSQFEGEGQHGENHSPVDANGDISIRRFRRYDGAMDYGGGDINLYDGSMRHDGLFDFAGGGNRLELVNISDRLNGGFSIRRQEKGEPLIYRYPDIEDDVPDVFGSYSSQIIAGAIENEDTTTRMERKRQ